MSAVTIDRSTPAETTYYLATIDGRRWDVFVVRFRESPEMPLVVIGGRAYDLDGTTEDVIAEAVRRYQVDCPEVVSGVVPS